MSLQRGGCRGVDRQARHHEGAEAIGIRHIAGMARESAVAGMVSAVMTSSR
jgi:hypothetical protein